MIYTWLSSGGVLIKEPVDIVDFEFLGLDRLKPSTRSSIMQDEDAFCQRLRKLGAKWWDSEEDYFKVLLRERDQTSEEAAELIFGWPSSGDVWLLRASSDRALPKDLGRLHMALDMEERCHIIEEDGGLFYQDPNDVLELS